MAVMTDVREAAQNLIEYAIHRSMIGQDDRIWAYNTILECIGATGPALDMAWALKTEKISLLHPDTLPDFDLEGTLAALSEAAVANGAAEDTASGRDRIAMRCAPSWATVPACAPFTTGTRTAWSTSAGRP